MRPVHAPLAPLALAGTWMTPAVAPAAAQDPWREQVLEETAHEMIASRAPAAEVGAKQRAATARIIASLRAIWPAFDHRNIGPEALDYFAQTFPIREDDRQLLVDRYLVPIIGPVSF